MGLHLIHLIVMNLNSKSPSISKITVRFLDCRPRTMLDVGKREPTLSSQILVSGIHDGSASDPWVREVLASRAYGSNIMPTVG